MAAPRKCSHCGGVGHNSRTCAHPGGELKIFGVLICSASGSIRKSASTGNLFETTSASPSEGIAGARHDGYATEENCHCSRQRKKGVPWSKEEHKLFLQALHKLGKGDWRGISKQFVKTRTPTQVASHAQKYFLRQNDMMKRRRRSSLFDMAPDVVASDAVEEHRETSKSAVVKDSNLPRQTSWTDGADTSPPSMKGQQVSKDGDYYAVSGTPASLLDGLGCCLHTSSYVQSLGWKHPDFSNPAFCPYYALPGFQAFHGFAQCPKNESKVLRPIPLTPPAPEMRMSQLNNVSMSYSCKDSFHVPQISRDGESGRSAFHNLIPVKNSDFPESKSLVQSH